MGDSRNLQETQQTDDGMADLRNLQETQQTDDGMGDFVNNNIGAGQGLINARGENNCFVNSALQVYLF